jgi:hypothetical protein
VPEVLPLIAIDHAKTFAMRMPGQVQPRPVIEPGAFHDQRFAFPMTDRVPHEARVREVALDDPAKQAMLQELLATTTDPDGKLRETIRYELDEAGRFSSGEISGPNGRLRFKSRYKYDDAGHLLEETQSAEDGTLLHKIVYSYDAAGKQTGYSVFDTSGKLVGGKSAAKARPSSTPKAGVKKSR